MMKIIRNLCVFSMNRLDGNAGSGSGRTGSGAILSDFTKILKQVSDFQLPLNSVFLSKKVFEKIDFYF